MPLAELLEPLIKNTSYSKDIEYIVKIILISSRDALRYAALEIIASGLNIVTIADELLKEADLLLQNEEVDYVLNYWEFLSLLNELKYEEQEYGVILSDYAFSESIELSRELGKRLKKSFPYGFSSLESEGGVNLIWKNTDLDKEVRVKLPFKDTLEKSLYFREGNKSELIKNFSTDKIYEILIWLSTEKSINGL